MIIASKLETRSDFRPRIIRLSLFYSVDNVSHSLVAKTNLNSYSPVYFSACNVGRYAPELCHHLTVYLNHTAVPFNRALPPVVPVMSHSFLFAKNTIKIVAVTAYNNMYHVHCGVTLIRFSTV